MGVAVMRHPRTMKLAAAILLLLLVGCVGLLTIPAALERREIEQQFENVTGIANLEVWGDSDVGISASFDTPGGGPLLLRGLSLKSFAQSPRIYVERAGDLKALTHACVKGNGWVSKGWTHTFELGLKGRHAHHLQTPIKSVGDAASRYAEITKLFAEMPRCPEYLEIELPAWPGSHRYCTVSPEQHWPDFSPDQDCERLGKDAA